MLNWMLNLKSLSRQLYYEELEVDDNNANYTIVKCVLTKDDWEYLANEKHVFGPFKEGQKICEAQKYVSLYLTPFFKDNPQGDHGP
jgi:hypothetical protein